MSKTATSSAMKLAPRLPHTGLAHGTPFNLLCSLSFPLMNVSRGGVNTAVSITNDQQWTGFKNSLRDTSKTVIEIKVIFKSNELTPWKRSTTMTVGSLFCLRSLI